LGYSKRGGPDVHISEEHAAIDTVLREILARNLQEDAAGAMTAKSRQKVTDVQHLTAHLMAGHDAFVTSDQRDMLRRRDVIRERTRIVIVDPAEAVAMARSQDS
jgi:hypothetical protein